MNQDLILVYKVIHGLTKTSLSDKLVLQQFNKTRGHPYTLAKSLVHITFTSTSFLTVLLTCGIISPMMSFLQSLRTNSSIQT